MAKDVIGESSTAKKSRKCGQNKSTNDFNARPDLTAKPLPPTQVLRKRFFANCGLWALLRKHFIFTRRKSKTYHPLCSASGQQATLSQRYTSASKLSCPMVLFGAPCPVQNHNSGAFLCLSGCWSSKSVD